MLLYICACLVLLSVVKSDQVRNLEPINDKTTNDAPKQSEAIFADVIKNISRVNNVLQDLINNYEQLQKIYKSQENVESVYSDSEIDEIFKSKNAKSKRLKNDRAVTKKTNSEKFAATRMFWSDHDEDNNDSNEDTDRNDATKTQENVNDIIESKQDSPGTRKTTTSKPVTSEESSSESSDASLPQEKVKKHPNKIKMHDKQIANIARPKQPQAEIIFVDTHRKPKETKSKQIKKEVKPKPKIEPSIQFVGISTKPKTRYSKVSYGEDQPQNPIPKAKINDTRARGVKKVMYSESFSAKKIWNDIISNKPIQLEAHNEVTMRRQDEAKRNPATYNKKNNNNKSESVIITKNKKEDNVNSISSIEDDELTNKEELKTNVLRQAYGDACLKLVLRKCFKACQKVSKSVCKHVKCKSVVKSSFKSFSKTGCIKEFQGGGYNETKLNTVRNSLVSLTNYRGHESNFVDLTRSGFLSAACLPHLNVKEDKTIPRNDTLAYRANPIQQFNILRDSFERACKRISYHKCQNACKFAYAKMCETHECSKRMKKMFKKQCKSQCKTAYDLNGNSDSDSDDDSDDSDDSDESDSDESGSSE